MKGKVLIRGGCVLTLGLRSPNFPQADVLIEDGMVAEIGQGLRSRDAKQVDASNAIVMPGFVDVHRHVWKSLFRNVGEVSPKGDPEASHGHHHRPDDVYAATLVGLLGAADAGITTVVDWSDIQLDDSYTQATLQAHADSGLRTVLVHSVPRWARDRDHQQPDLRELVAFHEGSNTTTLAFGPEDPARSSLDEIDRAWSDARDAGLRIHAHVGSDPADRGAIAGLAAHGMLGADVTLVHCSNVDGPDLDAIAASGAAVALTPSAEMAGGSASPPIQELVDRGIRPGLGIDNERMAPGDMFAPMRAIISVQHATVFDRKLAGKGALPHLLNTREVLRFATVDGARAAGLGSVTGWIGPGMSADIILLRTDRPNIFPINDPIGAVVWGMDTSNVDWVFSRGEALMENGVLTNDVADARRRAESSRDRVEAASTSFGEGGS